MLNNKELRKEIAWMTWHSKEGHIPSAYSILDLVSFLYDGFLNIDYKNFKSELRDYFVLSKGHGCSALYAVLKKKGVKDLIKRPKKLAKDASPKIPVIRHCLIEMEKKYNKTFDIIVDLDATSPLRKISDIKKALRKMILDNSNNLFTVCPSRRNPYFNAVEFKNNKIQPVKNLMKKLTSRQQAPAVYDMNASIYIWKRNFLLKSDTVFHKKTSVYIMPEERSIDIDTGFDYKVVSALLN